MLAAVLAVALAAAAAETGTSPDRVTGPVLVACPATKVIGDVPGRAQAAFEQSLVLELRKRDGVAALGAGEIGDFLSTVAEGRMRGCTQDDACLLEVAGVLGLNEILSSEIVLEKDTYVLTFRRLSARTGRSVGTASQRARKANGVELLQAVGPLVQQTFPDRALKAGVRAGVAREMELRLDPPPLPRWVFAATSTAAVVSVAAGLTFGKLASDSKKDLRALLDRSQTTPVPGAEVNALQDRLDTNSRFANVFLGTGAVLAAAAIVEVFFTDWHDYRSQLVVLPTHKGAAVGVGGAF